MYTLEKKQIRYRQVAVEISKNSKIVMTVMLRPYHFYSDKRTNFTDDLVPSYLSFAIHDNTIFGDVCSNNVLLNEELSEALINSLIMLIRDQQYSIIVSTLISQELYDFYVNKSEYMETEFGTVAHHIRNSDALAIIKSWNTDYSFIDESLQYKILIVMKNDKKHIYENGDWINRDLKLYKGVEIENENT